MATGMVLTVAQTLLSAMQTKEVRELCSVFNHESQLAELERTVETIKAVLLDAESKHQQLNNQGQYWLGKLKDAVYDADDVFDMFNSVAQQQKRMPGGKISKKLLRFFSNDNQLLFAAKTSRKIKKLRKKLDGIADDRTKYGFSDVYVLVKRREETSSYVYESSIIGRDADKETIFGMLLLDSDAVQDNVSFVSIVGLGGLGKTAVAQFVYQDDRIKRAFELTLWVCVSDEFGMKEILSKMLGKSTHSTELTIEELQNQVRPMIEGKRYFLVLDDVWMEDRNEWDMLKQFLILGAKGSRVIVTTRSKRVARAIGDYPMHELGGLSNEDSWSLFERLAFNSSQVDDDTLVEIGKSIVKKCTNVPLSIRVVGSMLYEQDISKWLLFQRIDLAKIGEGEIGEGEAGIMPILMFSYYNLTPALKSCFSYCALFPKDHEFKKEMLINIWLAEGCLECPNNMRNIEDVGDEYFSILLHRCFFQDVGKNVYGEIDSVKMHDLIHDLAQQVAGNESCRLFTDSSTRYFNRKVHHLSVAREHLLCPISNDTLGNLSTTRTLLQPGYGFGEKNWDSNVPVILANCRRLRVLDLHHCGLKSLCNTLNNLSHLRYLDLSMNKQIEMLPKSISKLHNLQVLNLSWCEELKELPEDLRELVNLRHLDISHCDALTHMPSGMGSLSGLCTLTMFVVGGESSNQVRKGELIELMPLINLRGELRVNFKKGYSYNNNIPSGEEGSYLLNKKHIKALTVKWDKDDCGKPGTVDERFLRDLQPHHDLRHIMITWYKGTRLPGWAGALATTLPHLTRIDLSWFEEVQRLPQLSQIRHLKILKLGDMPKVEYMEDDILGGDIPFFPSLEELLLDNLPKLKKWWRSETRVEREGDIPVFPHLHKLTIRKCPDLTCFPGIPHVKEVELKNVNEALTFCTRREEAAIYLNCLRIDNVGLLSCPFGEAVGGIDRLMIESVEVESLSSFAGDRHASSIKYLRAISSSEPASEYTAALAFAEENAYDDMYNCLRSFKKLEHSTKVTQDCLDCLVYCSLFPEDYEIDRDTLIQLWMAEGLIKEEPMEDIAASYLRALCKHGEYISLLREDYGTGKIWYNVKRFEILEQVLENSKITPVRAISEDPTSVLSATETENYHVTLQRLLPTDLQALGRFSNISTLLLLRNHKANVASIPYDFFMSLQHLRALDLSKTKISELPSSIGNARCLRYLDLSETPIKRLPETTEFLLNLQTLKLQNCPRLVALPKATRKLMCLRHLDLGTIRHMHSMPAGMGALTNLRTLTEFIAGREPGCRIRELKNMNEIEGKFCLSKLENVTSLDDAKEAKLSCKQRLKNLELRWTDDEHQESIGVNHEVIKYLQPHTNLQDLWIICYGGSTFPSWISHPSFVKLTKITLFKCPSCQILPSLGQLPLLESLSLIELAGVRIIDFHFRRDKLIAAADDNDQFVAFPALQKLEIKSMLSLEKWSDIEKVDFPCLRKFSIKDCPKLAALFELTNTNALEYLELNQCTKFLSLPEENLPASLKTLMIEDCPSFSLSRSVDKNSDWIGQQHSPSLSIYQRNEKLERNE